MANMEFLRSNLLQTTTMATATAGNGSGTYAYLHDRNLGLRYSSSGYTTSTTLAISVVFAAPTVISHVALQNHGIRDYQLSYNSATGANVLVTVASNSATSTYHSFASVTVNSIEIYTTRATTVDTERRIGEWIMSERLMQFERNPSTRDYNPARPLKRVIHEMPDGGKTAFNIRQKFKAKIGFGFISDSFTSQLQSVYDTGSAVYFLPFTTTTGWAGVAHEVLWTNEWDFSYSENSKSQGQTGHVVLEETSNS